jgi:glutamate carboxypeptidase
MNGPALLERLTQRRGEMLDALAKIVGHESPSCDKAALDALARILAERLRAVGAEVEFIPNPDGGDHLRARFGDSPRELKPALMIGHFDTVWPSGTLAARPFRIEAGRAYGPGIFDMKASLVLIEFALTAIAELRLRLPRPAIVVLTSDEEIGSPTSRALIEDEAGRAAYALVLEPPLPGGRLKTARKGIGRFDLQIEGRAAHAGIEPEKGVSAIVELAHQILHIVSLADQAAGTTVNVGVVGGGTTPNVVPAHALAKLDIRVSRAARTRSPDTGGCPQGRGPLQPPADGANARHCCAFRAGSRDRPVAWARPHRRVDRRRKRRQFHRGAWLADARWPGRLGGRGPCRGRARRGRLTARARCVARCASP